MAEELLIGFGTADITPPIGVELCGFGWYLERKSVAVMEPLQAKAMVWKIGKMQGAVIACDLIGVTRQIAHDVRSDLSAQCGIPYDHIMVCATHTHSGPAVINLIGWGEKDMDYLSTLPAKIASAAKKAVKNRMPASLEYGQTTVTGISYNREVKDGQTDTTVRVLKIQSGSQTIGFIAHYACHPVVMCHKTFRISGDFVGLAANKVSELLGCPGLFLQGACGDQNTVSVFKPQEEAVQDLHDLSDRFAAYIKKALENTRPIDVNKSAFLRQKIRLPQVKPDRPTILRVLNLIDELHKYQDSLPDDLKKRLKLEKAVFESMWQRSSPDQPGELETEIQTFTIGDVVLIAHPAELFYCYQKQIQTQLSPLHAIVVGYANDYIGYVPTPDVFDVSNRSFSYPAHFVPSINEKFAFTEDVGELLTDAMVTLAKGI